MIEIYKIRKLSLWIFFLPFVSINICLLISINPHFFDNTFFSVDYIGRSGFSIPYLDGSLSISRASRTFPQYLIFKPAMVLTSILLCIYWLNTNLLVNQFMKTRSKKYNFMIFGILSAIFLTIHSLLLGVDINLKIFNFFKIVFLLSFIIFEIIAQTMLVLNFYNLKQQIKGYFNPSIFKLKIILVSILVTVAILSIPILITSENVHFKHRLEWNYFIGIILFYLLTRFFWKKA